MVTIITTGTIWIDVRLTSERTTICSKKQGLQKLAVEKREKAATHDTTLCTTMAVQSMPFLNHFTIVPTGDVVP